MYGGLGAVFFLLVLFLQQVGGYGALEAGTATLPTTIVLFVLSRRFGALADRYGPRAFMGFGPLIGAAGVAAMAVMLDDTPSFVAELLPGMMVFSLGLAITVAPLTAAILADAEEHNAGVASGVNNAVARVAGLLATASIGAVIGGTLDVDGFRTGMGFAAVLIALGGVIGLAGIRNAPRRPVRCAECPGGQLAGQPPDAGVRPRPELAPGAARGTPARTPAARSPGSA
jgi:MFS family permease